MSAPVSNSSTSVPAAQRPANPKALLFFLAHQRTYRTPLFSTQEVFCGPDTDAASRDGRVQSIRTEPGSFDLSEILRQLPAEQQPEILVVKADATGRVLPRNLAAVKCPRILLVGDTHHQQRPLSRMIEYARSEPFDFVVFDHTRHHARFFAEAGVKSLRWLPAIDYGFVPREPVAKPSHPLTFVGQSGRHHPYRRHVLDKIVMAGLPLETMTAPLAKTAELYADSEITLNISLNGDLNLRVFEALAAGGFLLTDALPDDSGLPQLFEAGKHLVTWRNADELIEQIRHYQAHPAEARAIRAAGRAEILRAHHPEVKLREFYDLVFSGRENPRYVLPVASPSVAAGGPGGRDLVPAYECLQELHRTAERVTLYCDDSAVERVRAFANLPRCEVRPVSELGTATDSVVPLAAGELPQHQVLAWEGGASPMVEALRQFTGAYVIAGDDVAPELAEWGFTPAASGFYHLAEPMKWLQRNYALGGRKPGAGRLQRFLATIERSADALMLAELAGQLEHKAVYEESLHRAVYLDRNSVPALLQLTSMCLDEGQPVSAAVVLSEAARVAPLPENIAVVRQQLLDTHAASDELQAYLAITHQRPGAPAALPRKILLVTNLFPPEELGGYGRMMWEFARGLVERAHDVHILCGSAAYLKKTPGEDEKALETRVTRGLRLQGEWKDGITRALGGPAQLAAIAQGNAERVVRTARDMGAELVLVGNLDFLGVDFLQALLRAGFPVLHALANARPGYEVADAPRDPRYWVAPCSHWNGRAFLEAGYTAGRVETLYPGARIDRFYRFFLPDAQKLRIAYASLVMPYKGAHILVQALARLHRAGLDFGAEIAGDSTDPAFLETLQSYVAEVGMQEKVTFPGFLGREALNALFARSNVLVFPSQFPEPFGISQVEAMASGLVVVSSGTGGAAEIIRHGQDGLLFPATDPKALAERLASLATQPELFRGLQTNAQRRATEFSVDRAVLKIEQLADAMLAGQPVPVG
jgi:glycosyltransferase involved in cell wall biosynthesis